MDDSCDGIRFVQPGRDDPDVVPTIQRIEGKRQALSWWLRRVRHRDGIVARAVRQPGKQTRRVAIRTNPAQYNIETGKSGDVIGNKLVSRVVKALTVVGWECVEVLFRNIDVFKERVPRLLVVSVSVTGGNESFVTPPDVNSGPVDRRERRGTVQRRENSYPNRAARHDNIGTTTSSNSS
jgi:hypothetical protein